MIKVQLRRNYLNKKGEIVNDFAFLFLCKNSVKINTYQQRI